MWMHLPEAKALRYFKHVLAPPSRLLSEKLKRWARHTEVRARWSMEQLQKHYTGPTMTFLAVEIGSSTGEHDWTHLQPWKSAAAKHPTFRKHGFLHQSTIRSDSTLWEGHCKCKLWSRRTAFKTWKRCVSISRVRKSSNIPLGPVTLCRIMPLAISTAMFWCSTSQAKSDKSVTTCYFQAGRAAWGIY